MLRNLVAAVEQPRNQEFIRIAPTQDHSRPLRGRNQAPEIAALLFIDWRSFPNLARWQRLRNFCRRPALDYIWIIDCAAAGRALCATGSTATSTTAAAAADVA